jgi:uncharacterized membrane protein YhhN
MQHLEPSSVNRAVAPLVLTILAVASLAAHLVAASLGATLFVSVFKPLTTSVTIALAWTLGRESRAPRDRGYATWILAGLACSLAGDVFLMLPGDWFVHGLLVFLVAHACYVAAFARRAGRLRPDASTLPYAFGYVLLVGRLAPHAGALLGPVALYGAVLMTMAWSALLAWRVTRSRLAAAAALGGLLFVVSDTLLAFGRFVPGAASSEVAVMTTYIAAQLLIAWSVRVPRTGRGAS